MLKATCVAVLLVLCCARAAAAGEYHVYSCRTPAGEAAPVDGWSGSAGPAYSDYVKDTCGEGGALTAALGDVTIHESDVDQATWTFSPPAFDTMLGATLWRASDADGGVAVNATYETWLAGSSENAVFEACVYQAGCTTGVGDPAQPLSEANRLVVQGTSDVTFSASDPGSGVWEATFSVDGKVVQSTVPNENGGRCRGVGQTTDGLAAFLYVQPCLPAESVATALELVSRDLQGRVAVLTSDRNVRNKGRMAGLTTVATSQL